MTRRPLIAGNWKMNTSLTEATALAREISTGVSELGDSIEIVVCPPYPWLVPVREAIEGTQVALGAQNCSDLPEGAVTGEVSVRMLSGLCSFVLVGHSERRGLFGETDAVVRRKTDATLAAGLSPIVCVGEALPDREQGRAEKHVVEQLTAALSGRPSAEIGRLTIAYEPIWAIGTGVAATASDAEEMAATIRRTVDILVPGTGSEIRILYGGSVTPSNSAEILHQPNVDGALIGGASLKSESFLAIARSSTQ